MKYCLIFRVFNSADGVYGSRQWDVWGWKFEVANRIDSSVMPSVLGRNTIHRVGQDECLKQFCIHICLVIHPHVLTITSSFFIHEIMPSCLHTDLQSVMICLNIVYSLNFLLRK